MAQKRKAKPAEKPKRPRFGRGARGGTSAAATARGPDGRPSPWEQERILKAKKAIERARNRLGETAEHAANALAAGVMGILPDSDASSIIRASEAVLKKVGLGDTQKLDVVGGPAVVVRFGPMKGHPSPAANSDGVEPDGAIEGTERDE